MNETASPTKVTGGPRTYLGLLIAPTWRDLKTGEMLQPDAEALRVYTLGLVHGLSPERIAALRWHCHNAREHGWEDVTDVRLVTPEGPVDLTWAEFDVYVEHGTLP